MNIGVFVLMLLVTSSIAIVAIIMAAVAMAQASRAARTALEVGETTLAETEGEKQPLPEVAEKLDALAVRIDGFENKTGQAVGRLEKLEADIRAIEQEMRDNAGLLAETSENFARFKEFRDIVEETHRRISDAFSLTRDTGSASLDLPSESDSMEPQEDSGDSDDDSTRPSDGYDDQAVG
jgi:hypothetical protein